MSDTQQTALLRQQQELLSKGRLSRLELSRLNEIQTKLRNQRGVTYQEAPSYKMSGGKLVTKRGIGGFNTPQTGYNPDLPADQQENQRAGTQVTNNGYVYEYDEQGGFNTVRRPETAQTRLNQTISLNERINRGDTSIRAKDLSYGESSIDLTDSRVQSQAGAVEVQRRQNEATRKNKEAQRKAEEKQESAFRGSLAFQGLTPVATSNQNQTVYRYDVVTPSKDLYGQRGTTLFGLKPKKESYFLTSQSRKVGSNQERLEFSVYNPKYAKSQLSISASPTSRRDRLFGAVQRFAGSSPKITTDKNIFVTDKAYLQPKEFLKGGAVGTGLVATLPLSQSLIFTGGMLGYSGYQTVKSIKTAIQTGQGYGTAGLNAGITAVDLYFTKGLLKQRMATKLLSSRKVGETGFEFNLPTRGTLKGTPVVNAQTNVVTLRMTGDAEALKFASTQRLVKGSRTLVYQDTYQTIFGKYKSRRLIEQNIKVSDFNLRGGSSANDFEIALTGQAKLGVTQRTLQVPKSQFGLTKFGGNSQLGLVRPSDLRGDIFTPKTTYSYIQEGSIRPLTPIKSTRDLLMQGETVVSVDRAITRRDFFSVKDADMSKSPFAFGSEYESGRMFVRGRFTQINPNVGQISLSSTSILGVGRRAKITRDETRFLNEVQRQKPEISYTSDIFKQTEFTVNPVENIAEISKARALNPSEFKRLAPNFDASLRKFDESVLVSQNVGRARFTISGRRPTKTLTSVDSDLVQGELISRETTGVTRFTEGTQTSVTNLQLQFGKVRKGARNRAPLLDIDELQPYTDTLTSRPRIVPSVSKQFGLNDEGKLAQTLANKEISTSSDFFPQVQRGGQSSVLVKPTISTKNVAQNLRSLVVLPTTGQQFKGLQRGFTASKQASLQSTSFPVSVFAQRQQSKLQTPSLFRQQPYVQELVPPQSVLTQSRSALLVQRNNLILRQPSRLQSRVSSRVNTRSLLRAEPTSRLSNELVSESLSKLSTRLATRTQTRTVSRLATRLSLRPSPSGGFGVPSYRPTITPTPVFPPIPVISQSKRGSLFSIKPRRGKKQYTRSVTALFQQRNIFKPRNTRQSTGIGVISGLGVRY